LQLCGEDFDMMRRRIGLWLGPAAFCLPDAGLTR
jgi:hypothetical protein